MATEMTKAMEGVVVLVTKYLGPEQLKVESYPLVGCENLSLSWMDQRTVDAIPNVVKMVLDWLLSVVAREMLAGSVFEIPEALAADLPKN